jgi:hypothetical protein
VIPIIAAPHPPYQRELSRYRILHAAAQSSVLSRRPIQNISGRPQGPVDASGGKLEMRQTDEAGAAAGG